MLDIHSHILPKMDDGSKSTEMSVEMLRASFAQGVDTMVASSHFYADRESPDRFLRRRAHAFEKLKPLLRDDMPRVLLGAEVLFFPGIANSEEVAALTIAGTNLVMIEMPFVPWSEKTIDELLAFEVNFGVSVILVHVERYLSIQKRGMMNTLLETPFYIQCNAEAFLSFRERRFALELLNSGRMHFIGSDAHNTSSRPQRIGEAKKVIEKKCGADTWRAFCDRSEQILKQHKTT